VPRRWRRLCRLLEGSRISWRGSWILQLVLLLVGLVSTCRGTSLQSEARECGGERSRREVYEGYGVGGSGLGRWKLALGARRGLGCLCCYRTGQLRVDALETAGEVAAVQ
jgi:hypothetical protein